MNDKPHRVTIAFITGFCMAWFLYWLFDGPTMENVCLPTKAVEVVTLKEKNGVYTVLDGFERDLIRGDMNNDDRLTLVDLSILAEIIRNQK